MSRVSYPAIACRRSFRGNRRGARRHGQDLPGELVGLKAVENEWHPGHAAALDVVMLCRFSFPRLVVLANRLPKQLFRLMSRDIGHAERRAADSRRGGFLINSPLSLYWMQGLNLTPLHGHTTLFGDYGMLGIGLVSVCAD